MDFGSRAEKAAPAASARWAYITLSDFRSSSVLTYLAYAWVWFMAFVAIAVYTVDTFTAVNLLVFDNWSSQVKPDLPFKYSKWIFSICILVSWVLCIFEWIRAIRVIRRDGVADSYMDPLAVVLQSMRPKGWRRFLVFKALSRSKKRVDYVALFVYFAFKGAVRVILAEGPRQVVNGLTLYSVMQADIIVKGTPTNQNSDIVQFFLNIKALAEQDERQAVILFSMLFTLAIWVFSALSLAAAIVLWLFFVWHHIPTRDGSLGAYCRRKIDKRLEKIVEKKVQSAIEDERRKKERAERKAELKRQKTGELAPPAAPQITRQPTLPQLGDEDSKDLDQGPFNGLERKNTTSTVSTLPLYSSRPGTSHMTSRQPPLPNIDEHIPRPPPSSRSYTQGSAWSKTSYESDAPLLSNAAGMDPYDPNMRTPGSAPWENQRTNSNFRPPLPSKQGTMDTSWGMSAYGSPVEPHDPISAPPRSYTPYSAQESSRPPPAQGPPRPSHSSTGSADSSHGGENVTSPQDMYNVGTPFVQQHERDGSQSSAFAQQRNGTPGPPRFGTPGPPRNGTPGPPRNWTPGPLRNGTPGPPRNGTPGPLRNGTPGPPRNATPGFDAQGPRTEANSRQGSFSRPFVRSGPAPASESGHSRQLTNGSFHSQQSSFSQPFLQRKPTPANQESYRPFTPAQAISTAQDVPTPPPNSYEMTAQRSFTPASTAHEASVSQYVPFGSRSATPTSAAPVPWQAYRPQNATVSTATGTPGQGGSYFGHVTPAVSGLHPSSADPAGAHDSRRLTTGYADILDDYGHATPGE